MKAQIILITRENKGYDISVYDHNGQKINTAWQATHNGALRVKLIFQDYYTDENGQRLSCEERL